MSQKNEFNQLIGHPVNNWRGVKKPSKQIMQGNHCVLEIVDIDKHAQQLFDALSFENPGDSWTYLKYGSFANSDEFAVWLKEKKADDDILHYVIKDINSLKPIGIAGYLDMQPQFGVIEVGFVHFSKLLRKSTAATEAMYLMMEYIFDELKYRRYAWKCDSLNQASRIAAQRLGFKYEGTLRQCIVYKNRNRDTDYFSILDSEWPTIKAKFQRWLHGNNFDDQGKQIVSLSKI